GDLGRDEQAMEQLEEAARFAVGEDGSAHGDVDLIRIALPDHERPNAISEADVRAVRELALLLERTSRMEALRNLLADADELEIPRDKLAYPAAAVALRDGDAGEAE